MSAVANSKLLLLTCKLANRSLVNHDEECVVDSPSSTVNHQGGKKGKALSLLLRVSDERKQE